MDQLIEQVESGFSERLRQGGIPRLISDVLNPLLLPPLGLILTSWALNVEGGDFWWVFVFSLVIYLLVPLTAATLLLSNGIITSLDMPERKSRNFLFLITIFCSLTASLFFSLPPGYVHELIASFSIVILVNACSAFLINLRWKISIHTAALSMTGAFFFWLSQYYISIIFAADVLSLTILLLLLPLMIWARCRLNVHTLAESFGGAVTGFLLTILDLSMLTKLW